MEQKNRIRIALIVTLIVIAAVFGSFGYSFFGRSAPRITLPQLPPDSSHGGPQAASSGVLQTVDVTVDTVQAVIASLDRADSYYRQLTVETAWQGGSAATSVQSWVDGDYTYVRSVLPSGQVRHSLCERDTVYYWYSGSSVWFTAPAGSLSADLSQRLPSYEDVLLLDKAAIADASFLTYGDIPCIYVETTVDALGYLERYWISTDNGLLIASQTVRGEDVIYSFSAAAAIQTPCPTDVVFALPDGRVLHSF